MASEGPLLPTAADSFSGGTSPWSSASNITAVDDSGASVTIDFATSSQLSHILYGSTYGFAIPNGATIDGIKVEMRARCTSGTAEISSLTVSKDGVTPENSPFGTTALTADWEWYTAGNATALFDTTWTPAQINASTFGSFTTMFGIDDMSVVEVDAHRITVYYSTAPPTGSAILLESGDYWLLEDDSYWLLEGDGATANAGLLLLLGVG